MRTKKELIDKLKLKGYDDSIINNVLEKLIQQRYIDDEYYAELYIKEKRNGYTANIEYTMNFIEKELILL